MPYEPTNWKTGDLISSSRLNHMEQGIAALYPDSSSKTIVVCPEQTVTITSENTFNNPALIQFDSEYQGEFALPSDYRVYVNGELLEYAGGGWGLPHEDSNILYNVFKLGDEGFGLLVENTEGKPPYPPEPGDYTVKIELIEQKFDENEIIFILRMNQSDKWELDSCNKTPNEMYEIYDSLDSGKEADNPTIFKVRIITPYDDITFETYPRQAGMMTSFAISFPDEFNKKLDLIDTGSDLYLKLSKHSITYGASKEEIGADYYNPKIVYNPTDYKVEITKIED